MKLTNWYPEHIKPIRDGEYEVYRPSMLGTPYYRCRMLWRNGNWHYTDGAFTDFGKANSLEAGNKWRGIKR